MSDEKKTMLNDFWKGATIGGVIMTIATILFMHQLFRFRK